MSKVSKRPAVRMPTAAEDKAITAAAKSDPDAQPLTPAQLKAMVPAYVIAYYSASLKEHEMNTLTASEARANLYRLIDQTVESHEPIIISGKRSSAVLLSAEDWSAIQETLYLLAVPGMRESIKAGMAEPLAKSSKALKW
jgi:antitoxin YefM